MVNMGNYEEYMLLYADGELTNEQEQALLAFVTQHPELKTELETYAATRMIPDPDIVYAGKEELLKTGGTTVRLGGWKTYAAAAIILLGIIVFVLVQKNNTTIDTVTPVVTNHQPVTQPVVKDIEGDHKEQKAEQVLHSDAVNPVAVETKHQQEQQLPSSAGTDITTPQPHEEQLPMLATGGPVLTEAPVIAAEVPETVTTKAPVIVIEAPAHNHKGAGLITGILDKKTAQLSPLEDVLNEKILVAKAITQSVKETDVTFKLGKKEIFTVRL